MRIVKEGDYSGGGASYEYGTDGIGFMFSLGNEWLSASLHYQRCLCI